MTYWSGVWATAILLVALAVTPAMTILRWRHLVVVRRMIGVTALVYTIAHTIIYFALRLWDFGLIANEMVTRLTIIIATISTLGLIPLGVTSLDSAVRRMGAEGWARLHNTVYVLTALALVHYLLSPGVYASQYLMSGMFFWLMAWRWLIKRGQGTDVKTLVLLAIATAPLHRAARSLLGMGLPGLRAGLGSRQQFQPGVRHLAGVGISSSALLIAARRAPCGIPRAEHGEQSRQHSVAPRRR